MTGMGAADAGSAPRAGGQTASARVEPGCVTRGEYRDVKRTMTKARVHNILGTTGRRFSYVPPPITEEVRRYKSCATGTYGYCISYQNNKLRSKAVGDCGSPARRRMLTAG